MRAFTSLAGRMTLRAVLIFVLSAVAAAAQTVETATHWQVLPGQRILLNGDSITRGYGFGNYTDPSPLRTIYGIARILITNNLQHPPPFNPLPGVWQGLNPDGTPKTVDTLAGEIQTYIRRGDIRVGDWMIYEDAGQLDKFVHPAPWPNDKNIYRRYRSALRDMVLEADGTIGRDHILLMTMFDYEPKYPWCRWDAPLDDGVHSGNDAIRDEAAALGVSVIDMNAVMDAANAHVTAGGWGRLVGPDGIHPNVYGNYVMALAVLGALGADIGQWKINALQQHFGHPESGGDVKTIWGFVKDPADEQRTKLLEELRTIVASRLKTAMLHPPAGKLDAKPQQTGFRRMIRYGRILDHPVAQPQGTSKPVSYELGKLFQLDRDHLLLVASMREQGGHDFEIGNDGFVFRDLSDILPERAIPMNRLDPNYRLRSGQASGVLAKYPVNGGFVPRGAKLEDGSPHPAAGAGFLLSTAAAFLPDRSEMFPNTDQFVEFLQARWDGNSLKVTRDELPQPLADRLRNVGFNCLPRGAGFLCPLVSREGIVVVRFEYEKGRWRPATWGKPFTTLPGETEPSLRKTDDDYLVYTRSVRDRRGRVYRSQDGLHYYLTFDHWNYTVPQALNQGLDGSFYLTTNTGPGWLRNPLLAFSLRGQSFVDPVAVHDEKQIGDDKAKEVPFVDHAIAENVFLNGRWRHFLLYRVCDLRETNGEGAPPFPQTGLYLTEMLYNAVTKIPFRF
jgi:hypothetical protein